MTLTNTCGICGIEWQGRFRDDVCPRCHEPGLHKRNPLADAPPLATAEIEAIKVAMMATGWVWKE